MNRTALATVFAVTFAAFAAQPARAQAPLPEPAAPSYSAAELDRIVSPIALYPDPLLAQVLAAATYSTQIPDAAQWADSHRSFGGDRLADAINADQVPWDPSVQALLPFPSVLEMMARDMPWTEALGNAVLVERGEVMDAVQRMRHDALNFGYLRSGAEVTVSAGPYIEIVPVEAAYIPVPVYDPLVVFAAPRPGIVVRTALSYRFGVRLGVGFVPWGWGASGFNWPQRVVVINRIPWDRTWVNRETYVHPYVVRRYAGPPLEQHHLIARAEPRESARDARNRRR
jgi:Protein of unknown function (DUF3300)